MITNFDYETIECKHIYRAQDTRV